MSSEREYEKLVAEMMRAKAEADGLDPSTVDSDNVHVTTMGPTVEVAYGGATVSLPAPSPAALDQWFVENGRYIAGALTALVCAAVGAAGAAAIIKKT